MAPHRVGNREASHPEQRKATNRRLGPLGDSSLVELTVEECLELLGSCTVGRIAVVMEDGFPVVLPVNHRLVETADGHRAIYMKTRAGNIIDTAPEAVAFQVDGFDDARHEGWSVLVRGWLRHCEPGDHSVGEELPDKEWVSGRDSLVFIEVVAISGRRLHGPEFDWPFHPLGYV